MAITERTLSEFLQHSGRVLPALEEGEIVLRRRDGEDLVLMKASQREALYTLSRAFLALIGDEADAATAVLPWLRLLTPEDRRVCQQELRDIAAVALNTGGVGRLAECLRTWEATALATWDDQRNHERAGYDEDAPLALGRPRR